MDAQTKPLSADLRPYLAAVADFRSGADSPRHFLERCLAAIAAREAQVGAFVHYDAANARRQAEASAARWRAGQPLSPIDGMPVGIKDIIETADFPTEMGSPLYAGWRSERDAASVVALRAAGAVIVGKTVTTEFAATEPRGTRNPLDPARTPGGSSSGSAAAVAAGMLSVGIGTQVVGSILRPASYCGVRRLQAVARRHQSRRQPRRLEPKLPWRAGGVARRCLAGGLRDCRPRRRRPWFSRARRPAVAARAGSTAPAGAAGDGRLGGGLGEAKAQLDAAVARLRARGVEIVARAGHAGVAAVEQALSGALALAFRLHAWECRWPLNTYRDRDAGKLSKIMLQRLAEAEAMTPADYRAALAERAALRNIYAELARDCDACVTLSASGPAPLGLQSTGNPAFAAPSSLLGAPAVSLPLFTVDGMPVGLQVMGFEQCDAALFGVAAWIERAVAR